MPKAVGLGESDFKSQIQRNLYYIDKTMYIKELMDDTNKVMLVTRPRRFGKTLNMSMLKYYFDINKKESKDIFNGLKIMEQDKKYTSKQNAYPCIYLTLANVRDRNYNSMIMSVRTAIHEMYQEHMYLLDSGKIYAFEKEKINDILYSRESEEVLKTSIKDLSRYLSRHFDRKVILLIDEYDVPLQNAYVEGYYEDAISFFKQFYASAFKDNEYLEKAVLTGVSRIAKESLFSGLNNLKVYTVMEDNFARSFGITSEEMDEIIEDFEVQEEKEEIKKWYDGYKIGNVDNIYNPWSVLNYLQDRKLIPYWVNTSSNDIIKLVLKKSYTIKEKIERLLKDEEIEVKVNFDTIIKGVEKREDNIWGLFIGTGYLKVTEVVDRINNVYKVKIPNYEIKCLFENIVQNWFLDKVIGNDLNSILKDLITLNLEEFEDKFKVLVKEMMSYMDVGENTAENFYHAFVLGMLVGLKDKYYVRSNRESGFGRYDIMLEPKDKNSNAFIMEFKIYKEDKEKDILETLENAKRQIEKKGYEAELLSRGYTNITKMVYAFKGKEVKIEKY